MGTARRLYFIDWLRVIAVLLLFPFHSARVFDVFEPFYVKSAHLSEFLSWGVVALLGFWQMPLFFLLAGMSAYFALHKRSGGQFMRERTVRLLVPFVFGSILLVPPQTWYGARFNAGYSGSFWQYVTSGAPLDVSRLLTKGDYFGGYGMGQMWFVLFLFLLQAIALPLFLWTRPGHGGERFACGASRRLAKPQWWWIGVIALALTQPFPGLGGKDWALYLGLIVLGYLAMADAETFIADATRHRWWALGVGTACAVASALLGPLYDTWPDPSLQRAGYDLLHMTGLWLLLIAFVGLGARYLHARTPALDYLGEAGYPLYILHQTVIVALAFYLVKLPLGWPGQYALLLASAVAVTFALYDGVRRVGWLRFCFGMKPKPAPIVPGQQG